jgi:hypothetical protein
MDLMIIIVCLGVGIAVGMYIASQIGDSIEAKAQGRDLVENLRRFERRDIMDRLDEGERPLDQYGGKTKSGGLYPVGPEHGGKKKRTLNELRQIKSRYSNSNKGKKK